MESVGFFGFLKPLLVASGISPGLADTLINFGPGGVLIAGLIVSSKFWIVPSIVKWLEGKKTRTDLFMSNMEQMKEALLDMNASMKKDFQSFDRRLDVMISDSQNNLDDIQSIKQIASQLDKTHTNLISFFFVRLNSNNIVKHRDVVLNRWMNKASELAGKTVGMVNGLKFNHHPLDGFFAQNGAESYYRHLCVELFSFQELVSSGEYGKGITDQELEEDLRQGFDRVLSKMIGSFKVYMDTGRDYSEQKHDLAIKLFETEGRVEFLS